MPYTPGTRNQCIHQKGKFGNMYQNHNTYILDPAMLCMRFVPKDILSYHVKIFIQIFIAALL